MAAELNPAGTVPVLELDDGFCLNESLAIIEYLEELHPEPPMIGTTPRERARVRAFERTADLGVLVGVARIFHNTRFVLPGSDPLPEIAEAARRRLPDVLRRLDAETSGNEFLAGSRPTIVDCTLFAAFEFARLGEISLDADCKNLARWYENFRRRPSAQA